MTSSEWLDAMDARTYVSLLYISFYTRPADTAGLDYWTARIDEDGANLDDVVNAFASSDEATEIYGAELLPETLITSLYQDLLNREPDPDGLAFYVDLLTPDLFSTQNYSLAEVMQLYHAGMRGSDIVVVMNKLEASNYFNTVLADAEQVYDSIHIDYAKLWLKTVGIDNLEDVKSALDDAMAPVFTSGDSVSLQENIPVSTVIYDAQINDDDLDIVYTMDDLSTFSIDASTGEVRFNTSPNYEIKNMYTLEINATNIMGHQVNQPVTISILDVFEAPPNVTGSLEYAWDSNLNTLTVIGTDGNGIQRITITDSNGALIQHQGAVGPSGEMIVDLQGAYDGSDINFQEIAGFDGNEYNAYQSVLPWTFTVVDIYGGLTEETFRITVNKALNFRSSVAGAGGAEIISPDEIDMVLQGVRDVGSTAGLVPSNRDIWIASNNADILGDYVYLAKQTIDGEVGDVDGKATWVAPALGTHIIGQQGNQSYLTFNSSSLGSYCVNMGFAESGEMQTIDFYNEHDELQGNITIENVYNIALGAGHPNISVLRGNSDVNLIESYDAAYIGYGGGGNDVFRGGAGDGNGLLGYSWVDGGEGSSDMLNLRYDTYGVSGAWIRLDMRTTYDQLDENDVMVGGWFRSDTVVGGDGSDNGGVTRSSDYFKNIELIIAASSNDILRGNDDANQLHGGELNGHDMLYGYGGGDLLMGGGGDDHIYGGDDNDIIYGDHYGEKFDPASNTNGDLAGVDGNDYIEGGDGNDFIYGQGGIDEIYGGDGVDVITGGAGADYMEGNAGADTYVYNNPSEAGDQIVFVIAEDFIHFEDANFGSVGIGPVDYQQGTSFDGLSDGNFLVATTADYGSINLSVDAAATAIAANTNITATHGYFLYLDYDEGNGVLVYSEDLDGNGDETIIAYLELDLTVETMGDFSAANFVLF